MFDNPCNSCGRIFNVDGAFDLGEKTIIGSSNDEPLVLEPFWNGFFPASKASTVKPNQYG
jgi:hypothetical protein